MSSRTQSVSPIEWTDSAALQIYTPPERSEAGLSHTSQVPGLHPHLDPAIQYQSKQARNSSLGFLSAGSSPLLGRGVSASMVGGVNARPLGFEPFDQQREADMHNQILYLEAMLRAQQAGPGHVHAEPMQSVQAVRVAAPGLIAEHLSPEIDPNGWFVDKPRAHTSFPKVPHWKKSDWKKSNKTSTTPGEAKGQKGPTRMAENENVVFRFITNAEGMTVDGDRIHTICRRFREFCVYLYREKRAPATWQRGIDAQIVVEYHHWMRTQCFELQLCEDNWKADKVAILANYSQWRKKYEARLARFAAKAKAAKKAKAAAKKKAGKGKERAQEEDVSADEEDQDFQQDLAGAAKVRDVLSAAHFHMSPAPGDESASGTHGPSRRGPSPGPSDDEPASKRQRTIGLTATTSLSPSSLPPINILPAPDVPPDVGLAPTAGEPKATSATKPKVKFRNPLADMEWSAESEAIAAAGLGPITQLVAAIPPPSAAVSESSSATSLSMANDPAHALPVSDRVRALPAASVAAPSSLLAASTAVASVPAPTIAAPKESSASTSDSSEPKKRVPRPRMVTSWPPPDDQDHAKPKDVCARVWARNHPDGNREDYDLWYRRMRPYHRQLYAATNGARGNEPETQSNTPMNSTTALA